MEQERDMHGRTPAEAFKAGSPKPQKKEKFAS
jgi:hypothetical protein